MPGNARGAEQGNDIVMIAAQCRISMHTHGLRCIDLKELDTEFPSAEFHVGEVGRCPLCFGATGAESLAYCEPPGHVDAGVLSLLKVPVLPSTRKRVRCRRNCPSQTPPPQSGLTKSCMHVERLSWSQPTFHFGLPFLSIFSPGPNMFTFFHFWGAKSQAESVFRTGPRQRLLHVSFGVHLIPLSGCMFEGQESP